MSRAGKRLRSSTWCKLWCNVGTLELWQVPSGLHGWFMPWACSWLLASSCRSCLTQRLSLTICQTSWWLPNDTLLPVRTVATQTSESEVHLARLIRFLTSALSAPAHNCDPTKEVTQRSNQWCGLLYGSRAMDKVMNAPCGQAQRVQRDNAPVVLPSFFYLLGPKAFFYLVRFAILCCGLYQSPSLGIILPLFLKSPLQYVCPVSSILYIFRYSICSILGIQGKALPHHGQSVKLLKPNRHTTPSHKHHNESISNHIEH